MDFDGYKDYGKARREANCRDSAALLRFHGVRFRSANSGTLLVIEDSRPETPKGRGRIEFWPSRGKWKVRGSSDIHETGVRGVLRHLGIQEDQQ